MGWVEMLDLILMCANAFAAGVLSCLSLGYLAQQMS
jgi:hypothetical protein